MPLECGDIAGGPAERVDQRQRCELALRGSRCTPHLDAAPMSYGKVGLVGREKGAADRTAEVDVGEHGTAR